MQNETDFKQKAMCVKSNTVLGLLETTVLATAIAGLLYTVYFQLAPWIWSQNMPFKPAEITPWILPWLEQQDGIELYALYTLMFLNLLCAYVATCGWNVIADRPIRHLFSLTLVTESLVFIGQIGFHPPMSTLANRTVPDIVLQSLTVMAAVLPVVISLYYLQKHSARWTLVMAAFMLIPVCFISTKPISWFFYQYILDPALRLFHGASISEIYFQYDLLPSLIGLVWMKLQLDLNLIQIVGQCAYYMLILGAFAFARQWFMDKRLPVFLLVALVLVRIYAGPYDAVEAFQVTPLRLDMWLILLMLVYFKGPHHWSAGLFCGLMLLLHKNFGIIYSAAYIQLLLTLCVIETAMIPGKLIETASAALNSFLKRNYHNLALILVGALAHYLLFRNPIVQSDFDYPQLGIGFMKIATNSFYWYVVVMSGLSFALLIRLRSMVSSSYLATGLCLIYLAIGNSLYFFGRSHENNIINISVILLLLFFLLIDIAGRFLGNASDEPTKPFIHRNLAIIVSLLFITSTTIWYGDSITRKATIQAQNISKGQFVYPASISKQSVMRVIADVKSVTGDNPKVYFVGENDFLLNYYGGYAPVGYFNPVYAWISKRELSKFLQGLVDQGYYLVIDDGPAQEVLSSISISNYRYIRGSLVAWK